MPRARQEAIDLLVGVAYVLAVLVGTRRAIRICPAILRVVERDYRSVDRFNGVSGVRRIDKGFAVIVKVGIEALSIHAHSGLYVIVDACGEAVARPVVIVRALIFAVCYRYVIALWGRHDALRRLEIVDTAVRLIPCAAQQHAKFLAAAEALANRAVNPSASVAILNGV